MSANLLSLNSSRVTRALVTVMFFSVAIDMGGEFGLRNVLLPICALLLAMMSGQVLPKGWLAPFFILVTYPTIALLIGILGGAEIALAISQYQSTVLAFILFILLFNLPYEVTMDALLYSLFAVALSAVGLAMGLVLGIDSVAQILSLMADKGGGYFGMRGIGIEEYVPNVYFKASLFFVPAFVISLFTKRYLIALVCFLALIAAVSKTGMVATGLTAITFLFRNANRKELLIGAILLITALTLIMQSPLFLFFEEIAANDSGTLDARAGHFESIVGLWSDNPLNLIFGFGLGSTFYSSGADAIVSNIEIDHFNIVRKYGILWAFLFLFLVLKVAFAAIKNSRNDIRGLGWALLIAFVVAGTNPVLISPLFFLFLFITMAANHQTNRNIR